MRLRSFLSILCLAFSLVLIACTPEEPIKELIDVPMMVKAESNKVVWDAVPHATEYELEINGTIYVLTGTNYVFSGFGTYNLRIRAIAASNSGYKNSLWSEILVFEFLDYDYKGVVILDSTQLEIKFGEIINLNARTLPESNVEFTYHSSNMNVAVVQDGMLEAKGLGTTTITVSATEYYEAYMEVTVYPSITESSGDTVTIEVGDLYQLNLVIQPLLNGEDIISYESLDGTVAFIGVTGVINALKVGETDLLVKTSNGGEQIIHVVVTPVLPATVTFVVTLPNPLADGFEMYLVGSFNSWKVKDVIYKMTPVEGDPFKYTMTVTTFTSKTEVQYKYIMGSSTHYAWESYQNSPTANRTIYVPGGTSSVNDTVEVWQSLNLG